MWRILTGQDARERASEKRRLEELHVRFDTLENKAQEAEKEADIWKYLYDQVTGKPIKTKEWSEDRKKKAQRDLLLTHGENRRLPSEVPRKDTLLEREKKWEEGVFWNMYRRFKEMPLMKQKPLHTDIAQHLDAGVVLMSIQANDARKEWEKAKETDDYQRAEAHNRHLRLAGHLQLLALVNKDTKEEKRVLDGRDNAEKARIKKIRMDLAFKGEEPFASLEKHLAAVRLKRNERLLEPSDLEIKTQQLRQKIQVLSDRISPPQS